MSQSPGIHVFFVFLQRTNGRQLMPNRINAASNAEQPDRAGIGNRPCSSQLRGQPAQVCFQAMFKYAARAASPPPSRTAFRARLQTLRRSTPLLLPPPQLLSRASTPPFMPRMFRPQRLLMPLPPTLPRPTPPALPTAQPQPSSHQVHVVYIELRRLNTVHPCTPSHA